MYFSPKTVTKISIHEMISGRRRMGSVIVATLLCSASALTTPLPARLQSSKSSSLPSLITSKPPLFAAAATHRAPPPTLVSPPVLALRGGLAFAAPATIDGAFNMIFGVLSLMVATLVVSTREKRDTTAPAVPKAVRGLQWRFLLVFWLFKMADWLQGPYFYEVYASKIINGVAVSSAGVARLFLTGFGSTALFGAVVGGLVDGLGRKKGSLAFALMYSLSALSTKCGTLGWLFAGRVAGGIGTSLLFSAPEAWLVSEHQKVREESGRESTAHTAHAHLLARTLTPPFFLSLSLSLLAEQIRGQVPRADLRLGLPRRQHRRHPRRPACGPRRRRLGPYSALRAVCALPDRWRGARHVRVEGELRR